MDNYHLSLGPVPGEPIVSDCYKFNIQNNVEFWRELMKGVYTKETIAESEKSLDINLFALDSEPSAPADLNLPLRADS